MAPRVKVLLDSAENSNRNEASVTAKTEKVFKPAEFKPSKEKRDQQVETENRNKQTDIEKDLELKTLQNLLIDKLESLQISGVFVL